MKDQITNSQFIIIGGPTSTGKTRFALNLAHRFNGELINADSRQIYKYLNIGTNKGDIKQTSTGFLIDKIPIKLISFLNPNESYSVYKFQEAAKEEIFNIKERGKLPIIVGGTGLYIDSLLKRYSLDEEVVDSKKREMLDKLDIKELQDLLKERNRNLFDNLNNSDQNNPRRLIRLIEKIEAEKIRINKNKLDPDYINLENNNINTKESDNLIFNRSDYLFFYPKYKWEDLKLQIEKRVEEMFKEGLVLETQNILDLGFTKDSIALQGIGYKEVISYLNKEINLEKTIELVKIGHKQYAKRQRTWFEGKGRGYNLKIIDFKDPDLNKVLEI